MSKAEEKREGAACEEEAMAAVTSAPSKGSVVVLGMGSVGRRLGRLVNASSTGMLGHTSSASAGVPEHLHIAAVADSSSVVYSPDGKLPAAHVEALAQQKEAEGSLAECASMLHNAPCVAPTDELARLVQPDGLLNGCIVADCTATTDSLNVLCTSLRHGGGAALANKKHVGGSLEHYNALISAEAEADAPSGRLRFESTCGAGTPMVATAQRLSLGQDTVHSITGSLSGTLGVVCDALNSGTSLADAVEYAHADGLTEPDPRDDLGGEDVHRKALVLARAVGVPLAPTDVSIEPLYPAELGTGTMTADEFIHKLRTEHTSFQKQLAQRAKQASGPLKYVAKIDCASKSGTVGLQEVSASSPLGSLSGATNMVQFETAMHGTSPLAVQGAGAGAGVTASGVLADVVEASRCVAASMQQLNHASDTGANGTAQQQHMSAER